MCKAKSLKLITLISMLIVSLICALGLFAPKAYAAAPSANAIFKYEVSEGSKVSDITFIDSKAVLPLKEGEEVAFKNKLVVDDFMLSFEVPVDTVKEFNVNVPMDAYIVTDDAVENVINFKVTVTGFDVEFNGETVSVSKATNVNAIRLGLTVKDGVLVANVNGTEIAPANADDYKVKTSDKIISTISFEMIDLAETVTEANVSVVSVDTKASDTDNNFLQTFIVNESNNNGLETTARPRYVVKENFINEAGEIPSGIVADGVVNTGIEYTSVVADAYSVLGTTVTTRIKCDDANVLVTGSSNKDIKFNKSGVYTFSIVNNTDEDVVYETFTVYATKEEKNGEGNAPEYNFDANALESYIEKLNNSLFTDEEKETYIALGPNQYLTLPSMESLVSDDITAYKNLTYTIYYTTPETSSSYSSSFKIPVTMAGKYTFYVVFKDKAGNEMNANDFIKTDAMDPNQVSPGKYGAYVFGFEVYDNAPLELDARPQGTAYVGVRYVATNFKVTASENTKAYKLWYASEYTVDGVGDKHYNWKEVIVPSKATDPDAIYKDVFTYDDIYAINYDGSLTFTPHKTGYFKIECVVSSSSSARGESAESIIEVKSATKVDPVRFASNVNVPQIIFLSVGGLCLAGIIALLFVKPKTKKED